MAEGDFPKVMYHTAIRHRYNVFGRMVEGYVNAGDEASPNYPLPDAQKDTDIQSRGKVLGPHLIPQHHYRTILVAQRDSIGNIDEGASRAEVERLKKQGWVTDPNDLKEEYEDD